MHARVDERARARCTSPAESSSLAERATAMTFCRSLPPMRMRAMPLGRFFFTRNERTSILSLASPRSAAPPKSSAPRAPTKLTRAPARAAATAWLAPLPPAARTNPPPRTVSPGSGKRSQATPRSVFELPTTTMLGAAIVAELAEAGLSGDVHRFAFERQLLGGFLDGHVGAGVDPPWPVGYGPFAGVAQHHLDLGVVVDGVRLVARAEVEKLARSSPPAVAGAKDLTAFVPADEHLLVGRGDAERLAVHLGVLELDAVADALGNGMRGIADPYPLALAAFAPLERAVRAQEAPEDLGVMPRVQHDDAHAFEHTLVDARHDLLFDLAVGNVTPPSDHVGVLENLLGETVLGHVERGRSHLETGTAPDGPRNALVHAF